MLWNKVNDYLNTSKRSFSNTPNIIIHDNKFHTAPQDIDAINDAFLKKVKDLCETEDNNVEVDPKERLQNFLNERDEAIPFFELKKIDLSKQGSS